MQRFREVGVKEMASVNGGTFLQQWLDIMVTAMTLGTCGYGSNGFEGPTQTAYKNNKYGAGGP